MTKRNGKTLLFWAFFLFTMAAIILASFDAAFANRENIKLPRMLGLSIFPSSLNGPVASFISILAITAAGIVLIFDDHIPELLRMMAYILLAISLIVNASNILSVPGF
jgi:type IV secretory pathway VirB2 component (pilin)